MAKYLILRLLDAIPTVFLVLLLVFIAMRILPGDPAIAALGDMATTEQLQMFRERMGLNEPLWLQFINFVKGVLTLDLGTSMMSNNDVVRADRLQPALHDRAHHRRDADGDHRRRAARRDGGDPPQQGRPTPRCGASR